MSGEYEVLKKLGILKPRTNKMNPQLILKVLLTIGLGLFIYSLTLPYYKDQAAIDKLNSEAAEKIGVPDNQKFKKYYYYTIDQLETSKATFMDLGLGLTVLAGTILCFLRFKQIKRYSDLRKLQSLSSPAILTRCNLLWLLLIPSSFLYYTFRSSRGDYDWFAEWNSFSIDEEVIITLLLLLPLNLFIFLTSLSCELPCHLFIKSVVYNAKSILREAFWSFWLFVNMFWLLVFILDGNVTSIPINLFFTYVLLSLRAGQINKANLKIQSSVGSNMS